VQMSPPLTQPPSVASYGVLKAEDEQDPQPSHKVGKVGMASISGPMFRIFWM
jgi:hypothetical protein